MTLLTKLKSRPEAIDMRSRRFGYFPRTFVWRGKEYQVEAVERAYTTSTRSAAQRHYFLVRCADGKHTLYQDLAVNTWHIVP
jgi:hypothetical protein